MFCWGDSVYYLWHFQYLLKVFISRYNIYLNEIQNISQIINGRRIWCQEKHRVLKFQQVRMSLICIQCLNTTCPRRVAEGGATGANAPAPRKSCPLYLGPKKKNVRKKQNIFKCDEYILIRKVFCMTTRNVSIIK